MQVTVKPDQWGVLLMGTVSTSVGFTDRAKSAYAKYESKLAKDQPKPVNSPIEETRTVNGGGLLIKGAIINGKSTVRIGFVSIRNNADSVWWLPICWDDNHAMCGDDATCWAFVCIPKQDLGYPCTHDVHCKNNRCGDERGALWCVSCSQDHHCGANEYCSVMAPIDIFRPWEIKEYLTCRPKVRGTASMCMTNGHLEQLLC
jgi:hypothetical protein